MNANIDHEDVVDLSAVPAIPERIKVEEHIQAGAFRFDQSKVTLYLDDEQQNEKGITGHKLRQKLKVKTVYNVNLLEFYLSHSYLIPEEWKDKFIYFWGTIFQLRGMGTLVVRCLYWDPSANMWRWGTSKLDGNFPGDRFAATVTP